MRGALYLPTMLARLSCVFALAVLLGGGSAQAQTAPIPRLQAMIGVGASTTLGDFESSLGTGPARTSISGGVSARLRPALALDLTTSGAFGDDGSTTSSSRWSTRLATRLIWPRPSASPYALVGLSGIATNAFVFGGTVGVGVDWPLSQRFDLFQQLTFDIPFAEEPPGSPVNAFGFLSAGLRIRVAPVSRPVRALSVMVPDSVFVLEPTTFAAAADAGAARPITYTWVFDDGYSTTGETATREFRYTRPYTMTVTAQNRDGSVSETRTLLVHPPVPEDPEADEPVVVQGVLTQPPVITEMYGRRTLQVGELENFRVRLGPGATAPIRYRWDFGDGIVSIGNNVTHTYFAPRHLSRHGGRPERRRGRHHACDDHGARAVVGFTAAPCAPPPGRHGSAERVRVGDRHVPRPGPRRDPRGRGP